MALEFSGIAEMQRIRFLVECHFCCEVERNTNRRNMHSGEILIEKLFICVLSGFSLVFICVSDWGKGGLGWVWDGSCRFTFFFCCFFFQFNFCIFHVFFPVKKRRDEKKT